MVTSAPHSAKERLPCASLLRRSLINFNGPFEGARKLSWELKRLQTLWFDDVA